MVKAFCFFCFKIRKICQSHKGNFDRIATLKSSILQTSSGPSQIQYSHDPVPPPSQPRISTTCFKDKTPRFREQIPQAPPPGTYNLDLSRLEKVASFYSPRVSARSTQNDAHSTMSVATAASAAFKSTSPRFKEPKTSGPGVGAYNTTERKRENRASASFASSTPRFGEPKTYSSGGMTKDAGVMGNVSTRNPSASFASSTPRFGQVKASNPGPGSFSPRDEREMSVSVSKGKQGSFAHKTPRFKEVKTEWPAPGSYNDVDPDLVAFPKRK